MKTKLILITMTLICTCSILKGQKTVTIIDERKSKPDVEAVNSHKDKDVKITRIDGPDKNSYMVYMYRNDKGKLKSYDFIVGAKDDYDKSIYTWVNDTTMTFKLINSKKNTSENFKMIGVGDHTQLNREK